MYFNADAGAPSATIQDKEPFSSTATHTFIQRSGLNSCNLRNCPLLTVDLDLIKNILRKEYLQPINAIICIIKWKKHLHKCCVCLLTLFGSFIGTNPETNEVQKVC